MTPLKTLQTDPVRANELFAQLAGTTPGAIKTRERLFGDLKEEIELLARLEHDHLLPVLKKHAGTKTIVAQTGERLRDLKALLRRIDGEPKEGDDFLASIAELKTAFQQHLRDEKNALLPKVQKALSDEELETVAGRIEMDRAEVEADARHEAEIRRAEARQEREREAEREARRIVREERAAAEAAEQLGRAAVEETARAVAAPVETVRAGAVEAFRATGETTRSFAAAAQSGTVVAQAAQDASREWANWARTRLQNQVTGLTELMRCRTPQDVLALQGRLVREDVELLLDTSVRVSGIAASTAQNASREG